MKLVTRALIIFCIAAEIGLGQVRAPAPDDNIEGVQAAALDQPRIYLNLRRDAKGPVLRTNDQEHLSGIEAFLDTGASGVMLSSDTVKKLGIQSAQNVTFEDVGIGGSEKFGVTEPLMLAAGEYPRSDPETADYSAATGPIRMQIKSGGGLIDLIAPGMDVAGMPLMVGRVVVLDPRPLAQFDKISTKLLEPGDKAIPKTTRHVPLTIVSFARFTRVKPAGSAGPELVGNPMIGPNPFDAKGGGRPVTIRHRGKTVTGTFLLDTGAAASVISTALAAKLGVTTAADGTLAGIPKDQQFQLAIGGLGGAKQPAGTFFDRLELPTTEGRPIVYARAPLLITDITVADESGKPFTIDGVIGMNYLVASAEVTGGLLPDIGKIVDGPYSSIVIDFNRNLLGLEPK
ncbi:MAG TPA: aspartyl protease family protein [Tepidisphaeraceae bacterium]